MRLFLLIAVTLTVLTVGTFFYLSYAAERSHGITRQEVRFEVEPGENVYDLSQRLESRGLIASRYAFLLYVARQGKANTLVAGTYSLSGDLTIAEITYMVTEGKTVSRDTRITFPEGWNSKKMAERLTANNLPGKEFLVLVQNPKAEWLQKYDFLNGLPAQVSLEGFLFPDTYFFDPEASAEAIIEKMLANFGRKIDASYRAAVKDQKRTLFDTVTLASIVENEVRSAEDRKVVADIFLRRLAIGQALQSCATLQYILGVDRVQYSYEETQTPSPYNTYINPGLPPGPIGNPGLLSLQATLSPQSNPYFYFLSDPETGKTIFSVTYDEHLKNKNLYGL